MYAIIKTGGKQYKVEKGQTLKVEKFNNEVDEKIDLSEVLLIIDGDKTEVGTPTIANAVVKAEIVAHGRAKKVNIIKFNRRKHHRKQMGHRQYFSEIRILDIVKS